MLSPYIKKLVHIALHQKCVRCDKAPLFKSLWSLETVAQCPSCGFQWAKHDSGDGPAVFLSFILGFSVIPLVLIVDSIYHWPLWLHTIIWSVVILGLSIGLLKPSKALTIALQYMHRREDWDKEDNNG
jgi:uncharacterized protein (DUF983 family)